MSHSLVSPTKARPGDRVAVLSPSFAAPGVAPAVHEQAMRRLAGPTGLVPVEYPTTRLVGADPRARADDLNAAFADPASGRSSRRSAARTRSRSSPTSTRTWCAPTPSRSSGTATTPTSCPGCGPRASPASTAAPRRFSSVPGPAVDDCHRAALRAALLTGERLEVVDPGESEDFGIDWADPAHLTQFGEREPTEPWSLARPVARRDRTHLGRLPRGARMAPRRRPVPGRRVTCSTAGSSCSRPARSVIPAREFGWIVRSLGERGLIAAVDAVLVARPAASNFEQPGRRRNGLHTGRSSATS